MQVLTIFSLLLSMLSAGICVRMTERLLLLLTPGTSVRSRFTFIGLLCLCSPLFIRASICAAPDIQSLAFALAALFCGIKYLETPAPQSLVLCVFCAIVAICIRPAMSALLFPIVSAILISLVQKRRWKAMAAGVATGTILLATLHILKNENVWIFPFEYTLVHNWSVLNLFRATFDHANGPVSYFVINLLFVSCYPILHPGFCLLLPGLFFLFKKTDIHLPSKKILLASLCCHLLLIGGLAYQNLHDLIPAYFIWLLLLFPAWDRFFAYGLYFFKKTTYIVLFVGFLCQTAGVIWLVKQGLTESHFEIIRFK